MPKNSVRPNAYGLAPGNLLGARHQLDRFSAGSVRRARLGAVPRADIDHQLLLIDDFGLLTMDVLRFHIPLSLEEHQCLLRFLDTPRCTGEPDYCLLRLIDLGFVSERADGMFLSGPGWARLQLGVRLQSNNHSSAGSRDLQPRLYSENPSQAPIPTDIGACWQLR